MIGVFPSRGASSRIPRLIQPSEPGVHGFRLHRADAAIISHEWRQSTSSFRARIRRKLA